MMKRPEGAPQHARSRVRCEFQRQSCTAPESFNKHNLCLFVLGGAAMPPLSRFAPRLFFNPVAAAAAPRPYSEASRQLLRASTCLQCRIRSQKRLFAASSSRFSEPPKPLDRTDSPPTTRDTPLYNESNFQPDRHSEDGSSTDLPSAQEGRRSALNQRFSHLMDNMQGNIFIASQRINDLTGYSGIEALKTRIAALERRVQDAQEAVRTSRSTYKTTVADRASTQREVTTLLARKDSWTPADLERFTSLYRMDHSNELAVQEAAVRLADAEREAESVAGKLSSSILSRYHEEQIWSDKIRRMSTWGTWGLMGVNVLLFLIFQLGFEPWRRRRLVRGFEEKVKEALDKEKEAKAKGEVAPTSEQVPLHDVVAVGIQELEAEMGTGEKSTPAVDAVVACIEGEPGDAAASVFTDSTSQSPVRSTLFGIKHPETWRAAVEDLFSAKTVQMRKQDITVIALEGAATGAAVATIIATLLLRTSR